MNYDAIIICSNPNDQEQAMFEKHLRKDNFSIALRCVPLFLLQSYLHQCIFPQCTASQSPIKQPRTIKMVHAPSPASWLHFDALFFCWLSCDATDGVASEGDDSCKPAECT
eukprot:12453911-Ditylum_brightwellii.AAC.1